MCSRPLSLSIREATAADNEALLELEHSSPLDLGDSELILDRSPDYFACLSLQEDARVMVAEEGGRLVAVCAAARHCVPLLGKPRAVIYIEKGRTRPEFQRRRISSLLIWALLESWRMRGMTFDAAYWLISADNRASLTAVQRSGVPPWPKEVHLIDVDTETGRQAQVGAVRLGPDRAQEVVALLNRTHAGKELFAPYTEERLHARLGRAPEYGWQNWWGIEGEAGRLVAVAGLLDLGLWWRSKRRLKASNEESTRSAAGLFDFGYAEGGEREMTELLYHSLEVAVSWGRDHLSVCLDPEDGLCPFLPAGARAAVVMRFHATGLPVPSGGEMGRIYLDPAYL
jgi:GNAT superfamily N-acetyltransferase